MKDDTLDDSDDGMKKGSIDGEEKTTGSEDGKDKEKTDMATVGQVFSFAQTQRVWLLIVAGFLCAVISGVMMPAMVFYFAQVFEDLGASTDSDDFLKSIRKVAFAMMIMGTIIFLSMSGQSTFLETAAGEMSRKLKTTWFDALLRQDMAFYDIKDVSGTATMISTNGAKYKKGVGRKMGECIQYAVTFVGGLAYAFWASWRTSLVVLAVAPLMVITLLFVVKMNQTHTTRANASYAKAGAIVYTTVSSIRTVLSLNAVEAMIQQFVDATLEAYNGVAKTMYLLGLATGAFMCSFLLAYIPVVLYGSFLLYDNVRKSGCDPSGAVPDNDSCDPKGSDVFGALMGITFSAAVLPQVSTTIEAFTGARAACYPALQAMKRQIGKDDQSDTSPQEHKPVRRGTNAPLPKYEIDSSSEEGKKLEIIKGDIEFNDVTFSYPTRQEINVFDGLSLKMESGKTVAIVGPSGGGKSTTVQMIERFYDPTGGSITLDGHELKTLNVKWLRQQIGLVSQEPSLFATTIRENIAFGCPGVTDEQIEQAARQANAHDFIQSFPDGYETHVGDKGAQLSGGQKQRIAIARIMVKNPKILLLDEATSALDSESEAVVQSALENLMSIGNRTTVVIAHRLSTIKNADMIAVVKDGKVVETGTHAELLEKEGAYFDLVEAQKSKPQDSKRQELVKKESTGELGESNHGPGDVPVLRLRSVHFRYPSRPDNEIFRGLSMSVHAGETLAIVGPSGQGKSTVIQLIENFYRPQKGVIEFCGVDMEELNVRWLRDQIGLVGQEPVLFDTTIAENIRYGLRDATQEQIEAAARLANAHDFITEFPDGYDTQVGQGSTQISGGQKQRVAIARALLKTPRLLLLDEATSALDSESEQVVQQALDNIMSDNSITTVVIAHRLSTIRNADRIAVIDEGRVREIGTHDELMAKPDGRYRRLHDLQNLHLDEATGAALKASVASKSRGAEKDDEDAEKQTKIVDDTEIDEEDDKENSKRARLLAKDDICYFAIGAIGAILAGLVWPAWGFLFAYMIELLYKPVYFCDDDVGVGDFATCDEYIDDVVGDMERMALRIFYAFLGVLVASLVGNTLLFYGFGVAAERMNKRIRDAAFKSLVRQEIGFFDLHPVGTITSQLADDAALIHSFSGEPIRTLVMSLASILVGLIAAFVYMWPFALMTMAILPFLAFGAEAEMKMYVGEDEGDLEEHDENSPGGIVVETLLNIRTVASLALEHKKSSEYAMALASEDPTPIRSNFFKGCTAGLGQFFQFWGMGFQFWWGGWLLLNYPNQFGFRDFLISMFALLFALSGLGAAAQGATNREKAKLAAKRIFDLVDRVSLIDPLSDEGRRLDDSS